MPKPKPKVDRSKLLVGPLTEEQYRERIYLPKTRGIGPQFPERVRKEGEGGHYEGNVWVADKPPENFNLQNTLCNWHHANSENRAKALKAVADHIRAGTLGELEPVVAEARENWLYPGRLPWKEIVALAKDTFRLNDDGTPRGETPSERSYRLMDEQERKGNANLGPSPRAIAKARKRRWGVF